jgi:hypothetical protein
MREICSANLIPITTEGNLTTFAVSEDGLQLLLHQTGLDEIPALLQFAMNKNDQIDDLTKTRLLFGLLLRKGGLRVIKEDGKIIAPVAEIYIGATPLVGQVSFPHEIIDPTDKDNLQSVCQLKTQCAGRRAHQLIQFILHKLPTLPVEETLLGPFRLKSYSSVINKLFYRGKDLTDLLAATVANETDLKALRKKLNKLGATIVGQVEKNGNGDLTYRFVRILRVELEGSPAFDFPVYYEVVKLHHNTPVPHNQYEWTRLEFVLERGDLNMLRETGFTVESIKLGTAPSIDAQLVAPQRPQTDNGPNPSLGEISLSVCLSSLSIDLSLILMKCLLIPSFPPPLLLLCLS